MRIVFMGTPQFAVPCLEQLVADGQAPIAVYTQPARPVGRGRRLTQPPVARRATELGLAVHQPVILQRTAELDRLRALAPDLILTVAYGKIFRRRLLELPPLGCVNLHPSLLPCYRGLSPVQRAILRGDATSGVTLYRMTTAVDAGPILAQRAVAIEPRETAGELGERLAYRGAELTVATLPALARGGCAGMEQDEARASYAPRLERRHGRLDWRLPATQLERLVRALQPWPGTYTFCRGTRVKVAAVEALDEIPRGVPPGTLLAVRGPDAPVVAALPGAVAVRRLQPESSRPQEGPAFCCGQRLRVGDRLRPCAVAGRE